LSHNDSLFVAARYCLDIADPDEKVFQTQRLAARWHNADLKTEDNTGIEAIAEPGRPEKPELVSPRNLPVRKLASVEGRAAFIHALTHIEFNAINLALDAVYRFRGLPKEYYGDWLRVADEEAYHFGLLRQRLRDLGFDYGEFDAHNGLWEMAQKTAFDPLVRMALVPRVLEARGLDVTPGMMARLKQAGDKATAAVLAIILRDEIGHVEIGSRWFHYLCEERGLDPDKTYQELLARYMEGRLRPPFNDEARKQAGFTEAELAYIHQLGS
jgi:uncharacterized ferritin-like protein (DUF455 family)